MQREAAETIRDTPFRSRLRLFPSTASDSGVEEKVGGEVEVITIFTSVVVESGVAVEVGSIVS